MGTRGLCVTVVLLVGACANPQKKCMESVQNRAAGRYAGPIGDAAKDRYFAYLPSCADACKAELDRAPTFAIAVQSDVCVETDLLLADYSPADGSGDVAGDCLNGEGSALACKWLDDHAAE